MNKTIRYSSFENKFEVIYRNEIPTIQMPPHTHNAIELYISLTPLSNILLGDNVMPLKENSLLIIPSYCIHQFTQLPDREYKRYIITISTEWLENFIADNKRYSYFTDTKNPIVITLDVKQKALLLNRMQDFIACKNNDTFSEISIFFDISAFSLLGHVFIHKPHPVQSFIDIPNIKYIFSFPSIFLHFSFIYSGLSLYSFSFNINGLITECGHTNEH